MQETLILPLYSRKLCTELYPNLLQGMKQRFVCSTRSTTTFQRQKNSRSLIQRFGALEVATRQSDLAFEVRDYLKGHPQCGGGQSGLRAGQHRQNLRQQ